VTTPAPMILHGHLIGVTLWTDDPAAVDALIAYAGATQDGEMRSEVVRWVEEILERRKSGRV